MFKLHNYPKIMVVLVFSSISSIIGGYCADNNILSILCMIVGFVTIGIMVLLSITLVDKLYQELESTKFPQEHSKISADTIKKLGSACLKLDKYNVSYEINIDEERIHAQVTMGMYTRMSVANNLDENVIYHIIGTDTILVKPVN